jgi:hypothetical protein
MVQNLRNDLRIVHCGTGGEKEWFGEKVARQEQHRVLKA